MSLLHLLPAVAPGDLLLPLGQLGHGVPVQGEAHTHGVDDQAGGLAALGQHGGVVVKAEDQHLLGVLTGELAQLVQVGKGGQEGAPVLGGDEPELHGVFALQVHRPHGVLAVGTCHDDRGQKAGLFPRV